MTARDILRRWLAGRFRHRGPSRDLKLPTFLIIGANKAATTSLFVYLRQHPDIFMPAVKEPMFFTAAGNEQLRGDVKKGSLGWPIATTTLREYAALFQASRTGQARGEASTAYLANPRCAAKIRELIPDVRLIAILRNPIERAFSSYLMYWGNGLEDRPFDVCVKDELEGRYKDIPQGRWYLWLGKYSDAIRQFQELFGRDALLVLSHDEFVRDPGGIYRMTLEHIGVDSSFVPDMAKRFNRAEDHVSGGARPAMSAETRALLKEYFRSDIDRLASHVPFDPTVWLSP